jgi:serine-type D-Ala-D-Ala endopeptidase (penicillin-binding protein 7)
VVRSIAVVFLSCCLSTLGFATESKAPLRLASVSAVAMDAKSGEFLVEKHASLQVPIASLTKLMTAMVVLDGQQSLKEKIRFSEADRDAINHYFSRIRPESELPRGEVIRLALMSSENLAAAALGRNYPGGMTSFVTAMNAKAKALGMHDTHFVDSSGLSTGNVSTAADLAKMVRAAAKYSRIREYSTTPTYTANFTGPRYRLAYVNTNPLVRFQRWDVDVSKTGYLDEAGRCLVMQTDIDDKTVVIVMLDSLGKKSPMGDAGRIKRWLEEGKTGAVAAAAWQYQRDKMASYLAAQPTAMR